MILFVGCEVRMLKSAETIFKRTISLNKKTVFFLSTAAHIKSEDRILSFRTSENDPLKHTFDHLGQFYKVDERDKKSLFLYGGLPKSFQIQTKTFNETCLMIRQPSIDVINCIRSIDFSKPAVRFVLYGKMGSGKSLSLAHIIHYCFKNNFLIVHVPWVGNWMRRCQEYSNSETKEDFVDLNIDAAAWLLHFKTQNAHLLSNANLNTSEDHVWSKREITPAGSPLTDLVEHGMNRIKYASQCVVILCNEIKKLSTQGVCKTLVTVDGYNALFYPNTRVYTEKKEVVHPHKVTLTEGFLNLSKFDWNNGVIVLTVDEIAIAAKDQISHLPR